MTIEIIYSRGTKDITIPAGSSIAVFTKGTCRVFERSGYPQMVESYAEASDSPVSNVETVFGSYSAEQVVRIDAGPEDVFYVVGTAPAVNIPQADIVAVKQGDPTSKTVDATLTIAELKTKLLTGTHSAGATQTYTLPTGTLTDAGLDFAIGDSFDWSLINLSAAAADTITVAAGADHTVIGTMIVQSAHATTGLLYGNAVTFRTRKTAANTYVTYRI